MSTEDRQASKPLKILAVSDYPHAYLYDHFDREKWTDIDLVISCGDLDSRYLSFLVTMINAPLFYVRGNHDAHYDERPPEGCDDISDKLVVYKGLRILGLEGSRYYNGEGVQRTERQMRWQVFKLRRQLRKHQGVDIIVTHAPPAGVHEGKDHVHRGFTIFRDLITRYSPRYFLHGHTRIVFLNRDRLTEVNNTKVINVSGYYVIEV
ncbi:MAG: metallophosphoesterase [Limnochordia bacterium]|jgi:Icc-related predicted phosphoesterase|nr:metallophosphoesterase [Limnochordia bacterium]MDD2629771.1 metallophosphoesterase [Limnochordia bacterium]MDD4519189.1 metallophosphoesterase [Limnochordia bacterium]